MAEKTEKKSGGGQIIKLALVLFAVSAIMALALGLVNELTKAAGAPKQNNVFIKAAEGRAGSRSESCGKGKYL